MFRRRTIAAILAIAVLALLSLVAARSFEDRREETTASLSIGTNVWPGYEPLYLARSLGAFRESPIHFVEYTSATQALRAFGNGTVQAAALTLDEVLSLRQHGIPARVILVFDVSHGGDAILAKPDIASLAQLRGRRVGVESSALGAYVLTRALEQAGLAPSDVVVTPLEVREHENAYRRGEIDAVVTFEPVRSRLLDAGAVPLFDSSQIPDEIVDVLVVHAGALKDHPEAIETLLRGWFQALVYLRDKPDDATRRMAPRLQLAPDAVLGTFAGLRLPALEDNLLMLGGPAPPLARTARKLSKVMVASQLLDDDVAVDRLVDGLIDDSFVRRLQAPGQR